MIMITSPRPGRAGRWRRRGPKLLGLLLAVAAFFWIAGCVSTVTPPENPEEPTTVYLISTACHAGVVLPDPSGGMVDFAYGDHDWFALNHDQWYHVFDTLLWPTQGTLGRRKLSSREPDVLVRRYSPDAIAAIAASRPRVEALRRELEARHRRHIDRQVHDKLRGWHFVPDDQGYWLLNNCNDVTADWLRKLGCSVSWVPIRLGIKLRTDER